LSLMLKVNFAQIQYKWIRSMKLGGSDL